MAQLDADIILFGTAAETQVTSAIAAGMKRAPIDLAGKTAIADLPALLSRCHLFIGNDSGAMHVAAAVGLAGGGGVWSDRSGWDSAGDAAVHDRAGETVLQSVFSAAMPDRSSMHDTSFARRVVAAAARGLPRSSAEVRPA